MTISTLVLDSNFKSIQAYWKVREMTASNVQDAGIFDAVFITTLSARLSPEEWEAVLQIAVKRFNEATSTQNTHKPECKSNIGMGTLPCDCGAK